MPKPTQIVIKFIAAGLVALLAAVLIGKSVFDYQRDTTGVAVGVLASIIYLATRAAYMQGKKDAQEDRQDN
jgi:hypothetical protein